MIAPIRKARLWVRQKCGRWVPVIFTSLHIVSLLVFLCITLTSAVGTLEISTDMLIAIFGIYLSTFAIINDFKTKYSSQQILKNLSGLSDFQWEIYSSIKDGFSTEDEIQQYVQSQYNLGRAKIFATIASLVKLEYIRKDATTGRYVLTGKPIIRMATMDTKTQQ